VEEREREKMDMGIGMETKGTVLDLWNQQEAPGIRKQRRRRDGILQGPMRNFRKLQGPNCKTKFPVDLKP
jgi:hypothetical protein